MSDKTAINDWAETLTSPGKWHANRNRRRAREAFAYNIASRFGLLLVLLIVIFVFSVINPYPDA